MTELEATKWIQGFYGLTVYIGYYSVTLSFGGQQAVGDSLILAVHNAVDNGWDEWRDR